MAGYGLPTLPEKRCGGVTRGSAARREHSSGLTYTPLERRGGTSSGFSRAGPADATCSAAEEPLRSSMSSRDWNRRVLMPQGADACGEHMLRSTRNGSRS